MLTWIKKRGAGRIAAPQQKLSGRLTYSHPPLLKRPLSPLSSALSILYIPHVPNFLPLPFAVITFPLGNASKEGTEARWRMAGERVVENADLGQSVSQFYFCASLLSALCCSPTYFCQVFFCLFRQKDPEAE